MLLLILEAEDDYVEAPILPEKIAKYVYLINFPIFRILPSSPPLILFSVIRVILEYKFLKVANQCI